MYIKVFLKLKSYKKMSNYICIAYIILTHNYTLK